MLFWLLHPILFLIDQPRNISHGSQLTSRSFVYCVKINVACFSVVALQPTFADLIINKTIVVSRFYKQSRENYTSRSIMDDHGCETVNILFLIHESFFLFLDLGQLLNHLLLLLENNVLMHLQLFDHFRWFQYIRW